MDYKEAKTAFAAKLDALGLTIKSEFVPFSQSRNKAEKSPSLNWRVTLQRNGADVLTTDYSAGCAHCPAYNSATGLKSSIYNMEAIAHECEHGFRVTRVGGLHSDRTSPLTPAAVDVVSSLMADADVIDYSCFEDWANEFGFDPDSRAAEKIYRACLEISLKLRAAIGNDALAELQELARQL